MEKPQVSIGILTYNRGEMLSRSLESALEQTGVTTEILLVNNGSSDNTEDVCQRYAKKDRRIRLFHRDDSSIGAGRNVCLDNYAGETIFFLDDDDYMDHDTMSYLYANLVSNQADIALCGAFYDNAGSITNKYVFDSEYVFDRKKSLYELMERKLYNSANPCKLFSRKTVSDIRYLPEVRYDDIHTIYQFFANAEKVFVSGKPKYYFVKHESNNSKTVFESSLNAKQLDEYFLAYRNRTQYLSEIIPELSEYVLYSEWSFYLSMYNKLVINNIQGCESQKEYIIKALNPVIPELRNSPYLKSFEKGYIELFEKK